MKNPYSPLIYLIGADFDNLTEAVEDLTHAFLEAAKPVEGLAEIAHQMRMAELVTLSDLLYKRSSRMVRD